MDPRDALIARLAEAVEDLLTAAVDDKHNDIIALHSTDPPVIRANAALAEARQHEAAIRVVKLEADDATPTEVL